MDKKSVVIIENPVTKENSVNREMDRETFFKFCDEGFNEVQLIDKDWVMNLDIKEKVKAILSIHDKDMVSLGLASMLLNMSGKKLIEIYTGDKEEFEEYGAKALQPIDIFEREDIEIVVEGKHLRMPPKQQLFFSFKALILFAMLNQKTDVARVLANQALDLWKTPICAEARVQKNENKINRLEKQGKQVEVLIQMTEAGIDNDDYYIEATKLVKMLRGNLLMLKTETTIC